MFYCTSKGAALKERNQTQLMSPETITIDKIHQHQCVKVYMSITGAETGLHSERFRFRNKSWNTEKNKKQKHEKIK